MQLSLELFEDEVTAGLLWEELAPGRAPRRREHARTPDGEVDPGEGGTS